MKEIVLLQKGATHQGGKGEANKVDKVPGQKKTTVDSFKHIF